MATKKPTKSSSHPRLKQGFRGRVSFRRKREGLKERGRRRRTKGKEREKKERKGEKTERKEEEKVQKIFVKELESETGRCPIFNQNLIPTLGLLGVFFFASVLSTLVEV